MISIALTLVLSSQTAKDKTINDLAKAISTVTQRPAIAVLPSFEKVSLPADPKAMDDIISPLRKDGFASLVSDVAMIYQAGIPKSHWGVLRGLILKDSKNAEPAQFKAVTIPQSAVKDALITFETKENEAVKLGTLMNLELPRKIMVSPYFNFDNSGDFPVAISAKDMPYGEFVKALTRGVGGKLHVDNKTYTIGFDAANFRTQMAKLLVLAQKGVDEGRIPSGANPQQFSGGSYSEYQEYQESMQPPMSNNKQALSAALVLLNQTISQMPDQLLEQTFAYKGTATRLNLSTFTNLQNPAVTYLRSASTTTAQQGAEVNRRVPGGGMDFTNVIRRVDPRNPGRLTITTDLRLSMELNLSQGGNRGRNGANGPDSGNTVTIQVL